MGAALREGGQRSTATGSRKRLRRALVVSEVALAVVLVIGSGLLLRSFAALQETDPGFDPEGLLTFQLYLPPEQLPRGRRTRPASSARLERAARRPLPGRDREWRP